jgi:hypothetical protein
MAFIYHSHTFPVYTTSGRVIRKKQAHAFPRRVSYVTVRVLLVWYRTSALAMTSVYDSPKSQRHPRPERRLGALPCESDLC